MLRRPILLTVLLVTAVATVGCGSDDEKGSASTPASVPTQTQTATTQSPAKTQTADTTSNATTAPKSSTVKIVTPKTPTQKPVPLAVVRKREAARKRARSVCRANPKLTSANGIPCVAVRAEDRARRRRQAEKTGNQIPDCPEGKLTYKGKPCIRTK